LESLSVSTNVREWLLAHLAERVRGIAGDKSRQLRSLVDALGALEKQMSALTSLRIRDLIDDERFTKERIRIDGARMRLEESRQKTETITDAFEPLQLLLSFNSRATDCFQRGDRRIKRLIVETVGSNLLLTGKILNVRARKPFIQWSKARSIPERCTLVNDVRTFFEAGGAEADQIIANMNEILSWDAESEKAA
jgi:hypothetical protein